MIIRSLKKLLGISTFLAQIFAHNIRQLHELGEIDVKILVFLCSYSKFDSKNYQTIIESVWQLSELYVKKGNKPIKHYLGRLIVVSCIQNYMCIQLYFRKFRMHFPRLEQQITKIIFNYYNFLPLNILAQSSHSHL